MNLKGTLSRLLLVGMLAIILIGNIIEAILAVLLKRILVCLNNVRLE
jgi:hypothetical protein